MLWLHFRSRSRILLYEGERRMQHPLPYHAKFTSFHWPNKSSLCAPIPLCDSNLWALICLISNCCCIFVCAGATNHSACSKELMQAKLHAGQGKNYLSCASVEISRFYDRYSICASNNYGSGHSGT